MDWDYLGIFPNGSDAEDKVFWGRRGIRSFCGNPAPTGVIMPQKVQATTDTSVSLHVDALNTIGVQWQVRKDSGDWENIVGANKENLTVHFPHEEGGSGLFEYRCMCIGLAGVEYTAPASVTVSFLSPSVTASLSASTVTPPAKVTLSASAAYADYGVQWQQKVGEEWVDIEGETEMSLVRTIAFGEPQTTLVYRVLASGLGGETTSEELTLNVTYPKPSVTASLSESIVTPPAEVTLSAVAENADYGIQWQEDIDGAWIDIPAATESTLTVTYPEDTPRGMHYYRALASGLGGTAASDTLAVTIAYPLPTCSVSIEIGEESATLRASTTFTTALQWQKYQDDGIWVDIEGATGNTYTFTYSGNPAGAYYFRALASGKGGTVESNVKGVNVAYQQPIAEITASETSVTAPATVTIGVNAKYADIGVQWQYSSDMDIWTNITGETGATLTLDYTTADTGTHHYRCAASGSGGVTNSNIITIEVA